MVYLRPEHDESPSHVANLPSDAIVVRGGLLDRERTVRNAQAAFEDVGIYGLSVWSAPGLSAPEIVQLARGHNTDAERYLPHPQMRTSTVGQLRSRGFGLAPDTPLGHYMLTISDPPTDDDWDALQEAFGPPEATSPS